ncbi:hypothetical protein ACKUS4_17515 [Klebsiella oxytoca]
MPEMKKGRQAALLSRKKKNQAETKRKKAALALKCTISVRIL